MKRIGKETNIQALRKISSLFQTSSLEVDELLAMVMNAAKDIVGVKNGSLLLVQDEKTFKLQFYQAFGKNMGQLKDIDLLIVDKIGKNISGAGMDTNVIGRKFNDHSAVDGECPRITRIYVRDLTDETHGNASGVGMAEYVHKTAIDKMNREVDSTLSAFPHRSLVSGLQYQLR